MDDKIKPDSNCPRGNVLRWIQKRGREGSLDLDESCYEAIAMALGMQCVAPMTPLPRAGRRGK